MDTTRSVEHHVKEQLYLEAVLLVYYSHLQHEESLVGNATYDCRFGLCSYE